MRSIYGHWAGSLSGFLQILASFNPPPQAFTIFDSDGNGEIDIGKLSLKKARKYMFMYGTIHRYTNIQLKTAPERLVAPRILSVGTRSFARGSTRGGNT